MGNLDATVVALRTSKTRYGACFGGPRFRLSPPVGH
jgi:hypothetical protein